MNEIVNEIILSAGVYLVTYSPVFLLIAGIVLAFAIIERLIGFFYPANEYDTIDNNRVGVDRDYP